MELQEAGIDHLHVRDWDAMRDGTQPNHDILGQLCRHTYLKISYEGNLKGIEALNTILELGADSCVLPAHYAGLGEALAAFGGQRIVVHQPINVYRHRGLLRAKLVNERHVGVIERLNWLKQHRAQQLRLVSPQEYSIATLSEYFSDAMEAFPKFTWGATGNVRGLADLYILYHQGFQEVTIGRALYEGWMTPVEMTQFIAALDNGLLEKADAQVAHLMQ
jgi:phosphoribosylformimino-5-aminoimidazole carboxamide ribotide isomerase